MTQRVRLGDVSRYDKRQGAHIGLPYLGLEHIESGSGQFDLSASNPDAKSQTFRFSNKHVLYGRLRPYLKKVALPEADGRCSTEIFPILPGNSLDRRYLACWLLSDETTAAVNATCTGARMPRADMDAVLDLPIFVPSLKEQNRIVALLDEAFAGIATAKANAKKNLQNARNVLESHLESIFSVRLAGWSDLRLDALCTEITVGYVGPMKSEYVGEGVPFLRSQNIRPFAVSLENLVFIPKEFNRKIAKSRLAPGDIAIVRTGYPGTAAVIPDDLPEANCSDLVIMRPGPDVNPHFLVAFFNSEFGKRMVLGKLVGAAQKHFNVGAAKSVVLHTPPMPEQRRIVDRIDEVRAEVGYLESIYTRKLVALDELKQSLLQRAFSGQLP